jgi:nucleoside-diphosphate-sugar epimerase
MAYGNFPASPLPENAEKDPIEIYGAMKLAGEIMVKAYSRLYGLPYVIVRPSAVYGPTDNNQRVVQALVERAVQGRPITVDNPESTFLDFTYVADIARGLCLAALSPGVVADDFNITFGQGRSLAELVETLRQHFPGLQVEVRSGVKGFRPERGTLDNTKARRVLGYEPATCLEEGVAHYVDYIRTNNQSIVKDPDLAESASSGATLRR